MQPSNKLDYIKIRPFLINKVLGDITYRVRLPKHMRIHQVFYAALLELAKGKHKHAVALELSKEQEEVKYDIERIQLFCKTYRVSPLEPRSAGLADQAAKEASLPGSR